MEPDRLHHTHKPVNARGYWLCGFLIFRKIHFTTTLTTTFVTTPAQNLIKNPIDLRTGLRKLTIHRCNIIRTFYQLVMGSDLLL